MEIEKNIKLRRFFVEKKLIPFSNDENVVVEERRKRLDLGSDLRGSLWMSQKRGLA